MLGYHADISGHAPMPEVDGVEILHARWVTRESLPILCGQGQVRLPSHISIANRLIARWYGAALPQQWCRW
jgi:NADH pyrophosphatase NudC (nudix superfamily)